jgi:hypothetical protein
MYAENEILFPPHAVGKLRKARGERWQELVDSVLRLPEDHPESLAFSLMMIRLNGCMSCETDSYRAMRGCIPCAQQTLRRFKGSDEKLIERFEAALNDVNEYVEEEGLDLPGEEDLPARAA